MRDAENVTVRLSDYQPPDYLIDEIALVSLEPEATLVAACSRTPQRRRRSACVERRTARLHSVAIDGEFSPQINIAKSPAALPSQPPARSVSIS